MFKTQNLIVLALALAMISSPASAKRKVEKAGAIKDGVFQDATHYFNFTVHKNWKAKVKKKKNSFRLIMTQNNYGIPGEYLNTPDYVKVPKVVVYAGTSEMGLRPLIDSLLSDSYKSDQKKEIMKEFEFLAEPKMKARGRRVFAMKDVGAKGIRWDGQAKYVQEVQISTSSNVGKRVYGTYSGAIIGLKKNDSIILFHIMSEREFFESVIAEVMEMVNSLRWPFPDEDE